MKLRHLLRPLEYPRFATLVWWRLVVPLRVRLRGVRLGRGVHFYGMPIVTKARNSSIVIGPRSALASVSTYTDLGVNHPVVLRTLRPGASVEIGNDVGLSGTSICAAISVVIGSETLLGANVMIADTDFHPTAPEGRRYNGNPHHIACAPVVIGRNVFIGANSIVLKGVSIGENSVIGAGAVVSRDIPANVIAAGNPARVIRPLSKVVAFRAEPAMRDSSSGYP